MATKAMKACLFDMDGLLLSTEDMYTTATNKVLAKYNKPPLPWSVKLHLQGRPGAGAAQILLDWAKLPLTVEEFVSQTSAEQAKLWPTTEFLPGTRELLEYLHAHKIPIALATSSPYDKYILKSGHLQDTFSLFGKHIVTGDDPRIPPGRGKPAPDIYLAALASLNQDRKAAGVQEIKPEECLVFEDGLAGVESGHAANMTVIWIPHPELVQLFGKEKLDSITNSGKGEWLHSMVDLDKKKYGLAAL